ncbi:MAG: hypothetical protein JSV89_10420 [Spirochaetaceae bacterium]|nr:MAG: hypothetical protein JSV89_10420 [Spirochaetaceae bacterium]
MKKNPMLVFAVIAVVVIGACSWEIPEEVVFRAQPQFWIPTGNAVFDLDISEEIIDDFTQSISGPNLTAGEKDYGGYDGKPLILYAKLEITAPNFPDLPPVGEISFDAFFEDQTDPIDLSGLSGPIPEQVRLKQVPGWAWFEPDAAASPPYPDIYVRLRAEWTVGGVPQLRYLLGDAGAGNFATLASSRATANTFDLALVFNDRPADLVLYYEFGANSADVTDIDSLHLLFEVPFAFEADPGTLLDFEENGDDPLLMEDDVFGRDPADPDEDLDKLLESLRGSNAAISLLLEQTSGLGARLGMVNSVEGLSEAEKQNPANWVIDVEILPDETQQTVEAGITAQVLDKMIDGAGGNKQFIPEFLILVPEDFQINSLWELRVSEGYLRVQAVVDYNFSLEDEE